MKIELFDEFPMLNDSCVNCSVQIGKVTFVDNKGTSECLTACLVIGDENGSQAVHFTPEQFMEVCRMFQRISYKLNHLP